MPITNLQERVPQAGKEVTIVIVGGGFGGLKAARALRHSPVRIVLVEGMFSNPSRLESYPPVVVGLTPQGLRMEIMVEASLGQ